MDHLHFGVVEVADVAGVVAVGRTVIRRARSSGKGTVGASVVTGDLGRAAVGFGWIGDDDGIDAGAWGLTPSAQGPAAGSDRR